MVIYWFVLLVILLTMVMVAVNFCSIRVMPANIPKPMLELALIIRKGANNGCGLLLCVPCNPVSQRLFCHSLGCSVVALFNRVAGGELN